MSVYVPPASGSGDTCSGGCTTESQLQYNYVASYFTAHCFALSSYRYEFITWIALAIVILAIAAFHHSGVADQSWLGALWSRWAVKNRVIKWGRKSAATSTQATFSYAPNAGKRDGLLQDFKRPSRKVFTFPSFGRVLLLAALVIVPVVLTIVGADYIRPTAGVFDMGESWPKTGISVFTPGLSKRLEWGIGRYPRVSTQAPTITLPYRTWWTAGSRCGAMTNALTPLILVIALKQIPFALLSTRLLGGYSFDRLSFMHKWGGRIVWLFATAHVALWCVQMSLDNAFQRSMWNYVFVWTKFRWGFVSYGFFTLLTLLSIGPIRTKYYEFFYISHIVCVIGFMVTAWLHHPPAGYWMYVTLLWWAAERITRAIKVAYINGIGFAGRRARVVLVKEKKSSRNMSVSDASSHTLHHNYQPNSGFYNPTYNSNDSHFEKYASHQQDRRHPNTGFTESSGEYGNGIPMQAMGSHQYQERYTLTDGPNEYDYEQSKFSSPPDSAKNFSSSDHDHHSAAQGYVHKPRSASQGMSQMVSSSSVASALHGPRPAIAADVAAVLRPGFAYAQMLPGKTLRLTLRTPNRFIWQAGQYVNLSTPQVGFWQSHPFTIASAYNAGFPSSTVFQDQDDVERGLSAKGKGEERTIVLLIRARRGFTLKLWDYVRTEREKQIRAVEDETGQQYVRGEVAKTATGVHLRALIDGPYGSIQRVRWHVHSTVVIICGGSGISSGMSILEYLAASMAGNRTVKNFQVRRVRFVWMLREYSHLQWVASALRRCIELVPPELLQVELFVTKVDKRGGGLASPAASTLGLSNLAGSRKASNPDRWHQGHDESSAYMTSQDDRFNTRFTEGDDHDEYEVDANDLTGFAGEDNSGPSAAEVKISEQVAKEGKLRRAMTRRATARRAQGRLGRGGAANRPSPGPRAASTLAYQRSVYESSKRAPPSTSANPYRGASPIPERDIGDGRQPAWDHSTDEAPPTQQQQYQQSQGPAFRSADGYLNPHVQRHPDAQATSSGHSTPGTQTPGASPLSRAMNLSDVGGRRTPGASSYHTHLSGPEVSSTTQLNGQDYAGSQSGHESKPRASDADAPIDLDQEEYADLQVLAELARPGYPKLDVIVREEASQSLGRVLVSVCGPLTLGNLVRSVVSKQIDVSRIRKGHLNAHINVVTESYEWGG